jgi:hypothetical protein
MGWGSHRRAFEKLARADQLVDRNQRLSASSDYSKPAAILDEKGKPKRPSLSVIRAPKEGLWILNAGDSAIIQEQFRVLAAKAGRKFGIRDGIDPEGLWLHELYRYVNENYGEYLAPKIGDRASTLRNINTILCVCEASALFCGFLERQAIASKQSETAKTSAVAHGHDPFHGLGPKKTDLSQYIESPELTDRQRVCLSLRLEYGLSVTQISKRTGLHRKTIQEHLDAATRALDRGRRAESRSKKKAKPVGHSDLDQ